MSRVMHHVFSTVLQPKATGSRNIFTSLVCKHNTHRRPFGNVNLHPSGNSVLLASKLFSSSSMIQQAPPRWSFHGRCLPENLVALSSTEGKNRFKESLEDNTLEAYFPLSEQFLTQAEPAYCGLTSLAMVLNALNVDPHIRWKGGWRWWDEEILGESCCIDMEEIRKTGITIDQFMVIARNNSDSVNVKLKRPDTDKKGGDMSAFRDIVLRSSKTTSEGFLITSFARSSLKQTGDGHFSPIAGYHRATDSVLILDVARFKYAPYWVNIDELYEAMIPKDTETGLSRGWMIVKAAKKHKTKTAKDPDGKLPGNSVMALNDVRKAICPVHPVKERYVRKRLGLAVEEGDS